MLCSRTIPAQTSLGHKLNAGALLNKWNEWKACSFSCTGITHKSDEKQHACRRSTPTQQDGQWQHVPPRMRQFPGGVPASYPPGKHPTLDNPATYAKLDTEALFFAFYYQPGSYQQYLAAKELKRQSWRYHKGQRSWFQVRLPSLFFLPLRLQECKCSLRWNFCKLGVSPCPSTFLQAHLASAQVETD